MKVPLEYGDNFPVPSGSWDPAVPWRFPKRETGHGGPSILTRILPWVTLGLGVTLGILWVTLRTGGIENASQAQILPSGPAPATSEALAPINGSAPKGRLAEPRPQLTQGRLV